mgnify:CR=1 FL=1
MFHFVRFRLELVAREAQAQQIAAGSRASALEEACRRDAERLFLQSRQAVRSVRDELSQERARREKAETKLARSESERPVWRRGGARTSPIGKPRLGRFGHLA